MDNRPKGLVGGLILIFIGLLLLVGNLTSLGGWVVILGLGIVFLISFFVTGRYGFLIPGCLLAAVGVYATTIELQPSFDYQPAWFFIALGLGFLAIYPLSRRWQDWWPLIPGGILILIGAAAIVASYWTVPPLEQWQQITRFWPVLLILIGIWVLFARRLNSRTRLISGLFLGALVILFFLFSFSLGVASSFQGIGGNLTFSETMEKSAVLSVGGTLVVRNSSGSTTIVPGEGRDVHLTATKRTTAWSDEEGKRNLARLIVNMTAKGNIVDISYQRDEHSSLFGFNFNNAVDYEIQVPADAKVEVRSSSGDVTIRGISGNVVARTTSGSIDIADLSGGADAHASSGAVQIQNVGGPVTVGSSSGRVSVKGFRDRFDIVTSSGSVDASGLINKAGRIQTSSGGVRFTADQESSYRVEAHASSGGIDFDPRYKVERQDRRDRTATLGTGGPTVSISTSSGGITVR